MDKPPYSFNYLLTSELRQLAAYQTLFKALWHHYESNPHFNKVVAGFAAFYLERLNKSLASASSSHHYACQYLVSELAMFALLKQRGITSLVYPGTIKSIVEVLAADDEFLQALFKDYQFISLRLSR